MTHTVDKELLTQFCTALCGDGDERVFFVPESVAINGSGVVPGCIQVQVGDDREFGDAPVFVDGTVRKLANVGQRVTWYFTPADDDSNRHLVMSVEMKLDEVHGA